MYYKNSLFYGAFQNVLQISSPALQAHFDPVGKVLDDPLPYSSLGIALMTAVIAAFWLGMVWGLLPYILSLRCPNR